MMSCVHFKEFNTSNFYLNFDYRLPMIICIFLNDFFSNLFQVSRHFLQESTCNDKPALVQTMAWHKTGNRPFSEWMKTLIVTISDIYASPISMD